MTEATILSAQSAAGSAAPVLRPSSEADIGAALRDVAAKGGVAEISGGGSRRGFGPVLDPAVVISTKMLIGVRLYEPASLTFMARAGTPLQEVTQALAAEGQRLPFEPIDHRALLGNAEAEPTLGGATAVGASGPRRIQVGGLRDALLGVRFVNGAGEAIAAGGRVMKNVTGYDIGRLQVGAFGALGVITEICLKVAPRPETVASLALRGLDDATAVAAMSAALGSPFDVTGAAHLPAGLAPDGGEATTVIRLEGFSESVAYRAAALRGRLASYGEASVLDDPAQSETLWTHIRDALPFAGREGAVWRVSVKPSDGPKLVAAVGRSRPISAFYDWGGGLVWLSTPEAADADREDDAGAERIRAETDALGGRATLVRASEAVRRRVSPLPPEPAGRAALADKVRSAFDPHHIFSAPPRAA